ncbi:MAG: signal recognition particle-docking protein FtsY [Methanobrevibacter sp.]|uniref:signal recognition particle-docking protein FtsY n=1 Tax=Methanobrevibacter sp. TaxID=66852 RepID=UPI0025F592DA|nr:signal recognition particle-docking protein FtsY [Methanobrevibacter sp.]MBQ8018289.1 signal recognition particle-docking protein FtsY [Methanobrevibacter sp.]MBR1610631.1 signal recognition particle-docking protein FtsY [Methanobrevibacter sp.]
MFESLKKKFSRTSEKLEEELIEEAEAEDNLQEESGSRFSFFSFGKKKEEPKEDENLLPEAEESAEEVVEETKEEKKSRFWNRSDDEEETSEDEEADEESPEEKKSHFWSRNKDEEETSEDEEVEEEKKSRFWNRSGDEEEAFDDEEAEEEKKSHFWSRNKDNDETTEDVSADGEAKGGIFSFVREKTIQEKHVEDILFELEMELLQGDVAMEVATEVVESVKNDLVGKKIKRSNDITEYTFYALQDAVKKIISIEGKSMTEMIEEKKSQGEPLVVMFVGINGTGKTTTIGKLANYYLKKGYTPVIAASDTFRAGAIEQVTHHADNVGVKIIKHQKGSDPAAVAFDAVEHARAQGKELVLIDTAGRMQTNTNLMDEMKKIKRVSKPDLVIFVGDAITGNDATEQARKFNEAIDIDGVILTKADADSKGGASLSIGYVIQKPIMFLGVGQGYDDIMEYDSEWMLNQLFSEDDEGLVEDEA